MNTFNNDFKGISCESQTKEKLKEICNEYKIPFKNKNNIQKLCQKIRLFLISKQLEAYSNNNNKKYYIFFWEANQL